MIHEDFAPLSDSEALVSRGASLISLTEIARVPYIIEGDRVHLNGSGVTLATGKHLRLGNMHDGVLCYSDCAKGLVGTPTFSRTGIQPFTVNGDCYWNEPFAHGDCLAGAPQGIYRNGERFVKHWHDGGVVGKPAIGGRWMYFEAREPDAKMPQGWEVWRIHLDTSETEFVCIGANPYPWGSRLFFTDFSRYPEFFTRCAAI